MAPGKPTCLLERSRITMEKSDPPLGSGQPQARSVKPNGSRIAELPRGAVTLKTAVLLIDSDLGFVFWLGRQLDRAGYEAFPARSVPDARKLIAELHLSVGLVILSDTVSGAADFISNLRHVQKCLKIILLVEDTDQKNRLGADAQCVKPDRIRENSIAEWLQIAQRVLSRKATILTR